MVSTKEPRYAHGAPSRVIRPPATAAATTKVPASIRSGITLCSAPRSRRRPSTTIVSGAVRSTAAPIFCRKATRSSTSGSWAAGRMTVRPSASVAASIAFSVPITETNGNVTSPPRSRPGALAR